MKEKLKEKLKAYEKANEELRQLYHKSLADQTALTLKLQQADYKMSAFKLAWSSNFSQEAAFYRALADRAENRVKAIESAV